jgi:hypothetical protein
MDDPLPRILLGLVVVVVVVGGLLLALVVREVLRFYGPPEDLEDWLLRDERRPERREADEATAGAGCPDGDGDDDDTP